MDRVYKLRRVIYVSTFARLLKYVWTAVLLVTVIANQLQMKAEAVCNKMSILFEKNNSLYNAINFPKDLCLTFPTKVTMVKTVFGIL